MMKPLDSWLLRIGGALLLTTLGPLVPAQAADADLLSFSADVVRSRADKKSPVTRGKLYVSPEAIRGEGPRNGVLVVRIHHPHRKLVHILIPSQKIYSEQTGIEESFPPLPDDPQSPCRTDKKMICRQVGNEMIDGRRTFHWEIATRGADNRESFQAHLWIDPRLKMAIRERYADGLTVELNNIQEAPQSLELFVVPQDFQKVTPASPPPAPGDAPRMP
ncbi:MAG: hypothetical protein HQL91_07575 [Magnetococcales bacterium]|nr:hypothetical protein [Magnetococcales bacterium]